jgi:hypothetical protein
MMVYGYPQLPEPVCYQPNVIEPSVTFDDSK